MTAPAQTEAITHAIGLDDCDEARRVLAWLIGETRARYRGCAAAKWQPDREPYAPIRVVIDSELQYDNALTRELYDAAMEVGDALRAGYAAAVDARLQIVVTYQPSALAAASPDHPDAPSLWLAGLRREIAQLVTGGQVVLDPPWPGTSELERERQFWEREHARFGKRIS